MDGICMKSRPKVRLRCLDYFKVVECYISFAIPKSLFSVGLNAPTDLAHLQRPSDNPPEFSSLLDILQSKIIHSLIHHRN